MMGSHCYSDPWRTVPCWMIQIVAARRSGCNVLQWHGGQNTMPLRETKGDQSAVELWRCCLAHCSWLIIMSFSCIEDKNRLKSWQKEVFLKHKVDQTVQ